MDGEGGEWRRRWMEKEVDEEGGGWRRRWMSKEVKSCSQFR